MTEANYCGIKSIGATSSFHDANLWLSIIFIEPTRYKNEMSNANWHYVAKTFTMKIRGDKIYFRNAEQD